MRNGLAIQLLGFLQLRFREYQLAQVRKDIQDCLTAENLRIGTQQQNCWNGAVRDQNSVGMRHIVKRGNRWRVQFLKGTKRVYLKSFSTFEDAIAARNIVAQQLHGAFMPSPERLDRRQI